MNPFRYIMEIHTAFGMLNKIRDVGGVRCLKRKQTLKQLKVCFRFCNGDYLGKIGSKSIILTEAAENKKISTFTFQV